MTLRETEILISGGGLAGLIAAAGFGNAGFDVVCIDPGNTGPDPRTTAYFTPAVTFLNSIGIWDRVKDQASGLSVMRIADASGPNVVTRDFVSSDIQDQPFGWNLRNTDMRRALLDQLGQLTNVTVIQGAATQQVLTRTSEVRVALTNGHRIKAAVLVAADGRESTVRDQVGIGVQIRDFGQSALTFAVTHPVPHKNVSTEIHRSGGPFTLVPLPDDRGVPCSAVVWMERHQNAQTLLHLDDVALAAAATERSVHMLGPLALASPVRSWPIRSMMANTLVAERTALIAEAAHVLPPIGAQGLNLSLRDIDQLINCARAGRDDPGDAAVLRNYQAARLPDIRARVMGIGALNHLSMTDHDLIQRLRAWGLGTLHGVRPVRTAAMRMGLGAS